MTDPCVCALLTHTQGWGSVYCNNKQVRAHTGFSVCKYAHTQGSVYSNTKHRHTHTGILYQKCTHPGISIFLTIHTGISVFKYQARHKHREKCILDASNTHRDPSKRKKYAHTEESNNKQVNTHIRSDSNNKQICILITRK